MTPPSDPRPPRRPILIEEGDPALGGAPPPEPAAAPPPPDEDDPESLRPPAALRAARVASARSSRASRWFWAAALGLVSLAVSVAVYDFVAGLVARNEILGALALGLAVVVALGLALFVLGEAAGVARLGRIDAIRDRAAKAADARDARAARAALDELRALYRARPDLAWGLADMAKRAPELLDADALLEHAERTLMKDLDARAAEAVGKAARAVAATTALVPLALVDVLAALALNLRMIRAVAEVYGGRAGWLGSWRLLRAVAGHLVATGAVAIGDDLIGPALGGGVVSKLSRRFGEGLVNGVLTARVGAAAIEVCRPLPFRALPRPSARGLAATALKGLMTRS